MIPTTFEEWRKCIVEDCKINLTSSFAQNRLIVYENKNNPETIRFKKLYGAQHLDNVIHWYKRVATSSNR